MVELLGAAASAGHRRVGGLRLARHGAWQGDEATSGAHARARSGGESGAPEYDIGYTIIYIYIHNHM